MGARYRHSSQCNVRKIPEENSRAASKTEGEYAKYRNRSRIDDGVQRKMSGYIINGEFLLVEKVSAV